MKKYFVLIWMSLLLALMLCACVQTQDQTGNEETETQTPICSEEETSAEAESRTEGAVDAHVHEWGEWTETQPPTCSEEGISTRACAICFETESRAVAATGVHDHELSETKAASATEDGYERYICKTCPDSYTVTLYATGSEGLAYVKLEDGTYSVSVGSCTDSEVVIPRYHEGVLVTEIGHSAFHDSLSSIEENITRVRIPAGVTDIGAYAFMSCSNLTSVIFEEGSVLRNISFHAFDGCRSLTSITLPACVETVGEGAFAYCDGITHLTAPTTALLAVSLYNPLKSVVINGGTKIQNATFFGCQTLTSVRIPDGVTEIGMEAFSNCDGLKSVEIPESVTKIGAGAFKDCDGLTEIKLPEGITKIEYEAFYDCDGLVAMEIPKGVTEIDSNSFRSCDNLLRVEIPESVRILGLCAFLECERLMGNSYENGIYLGNEENPYVFLWKIVDHGVTSAVIHEQTRIIGENVFSECSALVHVEIPSSVVFIGNGAFKKCVGLTDVRLPDGVEYLELRVFEGCTGLVSIRIPASMKRINSWAFRGCTALSNVYTEDLAAWCGIEFLYEDSNPLFYAENFYVDEVLLTELVIPEGVTEIGKYAFHGYVSMTSAVIPSHVKTIGIHAFDGCTGLTGVVFEQTEGWTAYLDGSVKLEYKMLASTLANPVHAATFLTVDFNRDTWRRES